MPGHCARRHATGVVRRLVEAGIPPGIVFNVNFPDCEPDEVVGIAVTAQGKRDKEMLSVDERVDGRGNPYFWIGFSRHRSDPGTGTDLAAIYGNRISVTPLRLNRPDEPTMTAFAQVFAA